MLQLFDCTSTSTDSLLPLLLALEAATALTALSLSSTGLPDDFLPTLVPCTALRTLDLSQNPGVTAAGLQATLPALQQLQQLNLAGTGINDAVLPLLGQLPKLHTLVLADTTVSWDSDAASDNMETGQQHQQPEPQEVSSCRSLGDSAVKQLWQQLRNLDLSNTHVTDAGCQQLARQLAGTVTAARGSRQGYVVVAAHAGLAKLVIGSSSSSRAKLGKQGLAAVARISSLQQLTLQVSVQPLCKGMRQCACTC
jgi:hypothetical protein